MKSFQKIIVISLVLISLLTSCAQKRPSFEDFVIHDDNSAYISEVPEPVYTHFSAVDSVISSESENAIVPRESVVPVIANVSYEEVPTDTPTLSEAESAVESQPQKNESTENVWVSKSGSKYHTKQTCSNMKTPSEISLQDAISRGLEPCKKCVKT